MLELVFSLPMTPERVIGIVAGLVSFLAHPLYIWSILKKETVPHKVTWTLSALLGFMSLIFYRGSGGHETIYVPLGDFIGLSTIAVLAFWYGRNGSISRTDWLCVVGVIGAIGVFLISRDPLLALAVTLIAEILVLVPTIVKTYKYPGEEGFIPWSFTHIGNILNFFAIEQGNNIEVAYVWTIFIADSVVWMLILRQFLCRKKNSGRSLE
ncbi:MAG: hypothetical protein ACSLEX_02595 [Minisyncoccota bacterium]